MCCLRKILIAILLLLTSTAQAEEQETLSINLEESIALALQNNPSIAQSFEDREVASWALSQTRRQAGAKLSYSFNGKRRGVSSNGRPMQTGNDFTNGLTVSIPIYQGGKMHNQRRQSKYALNSADLTLENTKQTIKMQTTRAYYEVLRCRKMIGVREAEVNNLQEHLNQTMIRFNEGVVAKPDVLASTVSLANAKQNYTSAQGDYEKALANLKTVMNLPSDTALVIRDEMDYVPYTAEQDSCTEYALENRPDYAAALYSVKQAETAIKVAEADYRPTVSASLSNSFEGDELFNSNTNRNWQAGISVSWNIFDNNVTSAAVNGQQARLKKSQAVAEQSRNTVCLDVQNAYIDLRTAEKNIETTKIAVSRAEEDYSLEQVRYAEGIGTNLELIDSQNKLTQARMNFYTAMYSYNVAIASLEKAMGIPIDINVPTYITATEEGKSSEEALANAVIR